MEQSNAIRDQHSASCIEELEYVKNNRRRLAFRWHLGHAGSPATAMTMLEAEEKLFGPVK